MNNDSVRAPSGQALAVPVEPQEGLTPTGFDPSRWAGRLMIRCMGKCNHSPGTCTADPEYQHYVAWKRAPEPSPRQMQMQWHTEAGEVLFYFPSNLSARDVADVRELVDLCVKGMQRRASAIEARRAETQGGSVADESAASEAGDAPTVEVRP